MMTRYIMVTTAGETEITRRSADDIYDIQDGELWHFLYITTATGERISVNPYQVIMVREEN